MAATEATVGTSAGASDNSPAATAASPCDADDVAEKEDSKSEATVSEGKACNVANSAGKGQSTALKLMSGKTLQEASKSLSSETKEIGNDRKSDLNVGTNCVKSDGSSVIGETISFGLDACDTSEEKSSLPLKTTESPPVPPQNTVKDEGTGSPVECPSKPPFSAEKLLHNAVNLIPAKSVGSATCPPGAPIDSLSVDHKGAASLNVTSDRDITRRTGDGVVGDEEPIERELQPIAKTDERSDREGLCCTKDGKHHKNYGSLDSSVLVGATTSSPEEEISPSSSSTTQAQEGLPVGSEAPDEPTKKKKKRKKKKKGTSEAETGGAANLSDHENKVLTSPGTSGTEDSSKTPAFDTHSQPSQKQKQQTPLNGPSATQSKTNVSNKNRKSETKSESSSSRKQTNNITKSTEPPGDDSKIVMKSERNSVKSSKADRPKSLDFSSKIDAVRTIPQQKAVEKLVVKLETDSQSNKGETVSDDSDSGNEAEKSSEDTSMKASQESSVDETFQDDDESNGDGWQVSGQKKNKRRALAAEDRYMYNIRPSPSDHFRRTFGSGHFDQRLRKSSSEPSGMSKCMDDTRTTVFRHSSFSRQNQILREEFHSLSRKADAGPPSESAEKPPVQELANSYAAKLKAKPPAAPSKKSQENASVAASAQDGGSKVEDSKLPESDSTSQVVGDQKPSAVASVETESRKEVKSSIASHSAVESKSKVESDTEPSDTVGKGQPSSVISAATAAKSASLPRDMGRNSGTDPAKLDNTSADNVVQYLDLQCSNDTYAARLKQSINKSADAKAGSRASSNKQEKVVADETANPPRTSKLESSHKAVSLDSAQPISLVVPKKASSESSNNKNKDSMRTVKSETSLNLTSEGTTAIQDNSFPFEAQPAATFDITFGSVKFSESDFELIDEVGHGSGQPPKGDQDTRPVPQPPSSQPAKPPSRAQSPPPPANHVSCAELEKEWINKGAEAVTMPSDRRAKKSETVNSAQTVSSVPAGLAAILAAGATNNKPTPKVGENNNMSKKPAEPSFQPPFWSAKFNHSELANMLLTDWESLNCELTKQSSKVVVYEEE